MKYFLLCIPFLFEGCLYFNEQGISAHLYDNCQEYYDNCGNYHKECPPNLINYSEIKEGVSEIGTEIKEYIKPTKSNSESESCTQ
jgi:hypothetical protein